MRRGISDHICVATNTPALTISFGSTLDDEALVQPTGNRHIAILIYAKTANRQGHHAFWSDSKGYRERPIDITFSTQATTSPTRSMEPRASGKLSRHKPNDDVSITSNERNSRRRISEPAGISITTTFFEVFGVDKSACLLKGEQECLKMSKTKNDQNQHAKVIVLKWPTWRTVIRYPSRYN